MSNSSFESSFVLMYAALAVWDDDILIIVVREKRSGHTSVELGERRLILAIALLKDDLECVLAAVLLQVLEADFRRIDLVLNCCANEFLSAKGGNGKQIKTGRMTHTV